MNPESKKFPLKLRFLFDPWRYKVAWGGRGGTKSWNFARAILILGSQKKLKVLCAREIQKSLTESVHALLESQIRKLGLESFYEVQVNRIIGANGTEIVFAGLRHNVNQIKSYEDVDICWVEEAAAVSKASWDVLIPTIRKEGSEIWISFNPELDSDETWRRFVVNPPPGAKVVQISYLDNPWLPETLRIEAEHLKRTDLKAYANVWGGATKSALEGAIFAAELAEAEKEGRIGNVPRDRTRPVDTFWDLGFGDCTAIWFAQALPDGSIRVIDYLENSGKTIDFYLIELQRKGYLYGIDWLPHDAVDTIIHQKLAAGNANVSIEMLLRRAGRKPRIAPKLHVTTRINAGRTMFSSCWFDRTRCADGLQALRHYQWKPATAAESKPDPRDREDKAIPGQSTPLHNWASHGADAYQALAVTLKTPEKKAPPKPPPPKGRATDRSWMV